MIERTVDQAQSELASLIDQVQHGQEVILSEAGTPVAKLIAYRRPRAPRTPGALKGQIWIAPDFDQLPSDIAASFGAEEAKS